MARRPHRHENSASATDTESPARVLAAAVVEAARCLDPAGGSSPLVPAIGVAALLAAGRRPDELAADERPAAEVLWSAALARPEVRVAVADGLLGRAYEHLLATGSEQGDQADQARRPRSAQRRAMGAYYTPAPIVDHLVDEALGPVLDRAVASPDPVGALLAVRIVDPACGDGRFLLAAGGRLSARLAEVGGRNRTAWFGLVAANLIGVDVDPVAVAVARATLWLASGAPGAPGVRPIAGRIVLGDALLGADPAAVAAGVPDTAFTAVDDDDPAVARALRQRNRRERRAPGRPAPATDPLGARRQADAWCAAFLRPKRGEGPFLTTADVDRLGRAEDLAPVVAEALAGRRPVHWYLEAPDVLAAGGFDVVIGNPPFLNQLSAASAVERRLAGLHRARHGDAAAGYSDVAVRFLDLAVGLARPDGGRVGLVLPRSVLATSHAAAARRAVLARADPTSLWVADEPVFAAAVLACGLVVERPPAAGEVLELRRATGPDAAPAPPVRVGRAELHGTWARLVSDLAGVPSVRVRPGGRLADLARATADFRDQYYGLLPLLEDATDTSEGRVRVVTSGLIDPAHCRWGEVPTRLGRRAYLRPVVARHALDADLGRWAAFRLVPKVLVATQTDVIEAVVDRDGSWLPSVPVLSVVSRADDLWRVAAVLLAPPVAAVAAGRHLGAGLAKGGLRLRAADVAELPLPADGSAWARAAGEVRHAHAASDAGARWRHLAGAGRAMNEAYGLAGADGDAVLDWWWARLPFRGARPPWRAAEPDRW